MLGSETKTLELFGVVIWVLVSLWAEFGGVGAVGRDPSSAMEHTVFDGRYRRHSQGELPGAFWHQELVACSGYGARPKMAVTARQTASTWVEAGPAKLYPSAGIPHRIPASPRLGMGNLLTSGNLTRCNWPLTTHLQWERAQMLPLH